MVLKASSLVDDRQAEAIFQYCDSRVLSFADSLRMKSPMVKMCRLAFCPFSDSSPICLEYLFLSFFRLFNTSSFFRILFRHLAFLTLYMSLLSFPALTIFPAFSLLFLSFPLDSLFTSFRFFDDLLPWFKDFLEECTDELLSSTRRFLVLEVFIEDECLLACLRFPLPFDLEDSDFDREPVSFMPGRIFFVLPDFATGLDINSSSLSTRVFSWEFLTILTGFLALPLESSDLGGPFGSSGLAVDVCESSVFTAELLESPPGSLEACLSWTDGEAVVLGSSSVLTPSGFPVDKSVGGSGATTKRLSPSRLSSIISSQPPIPCSYTPSKSIESCMDRQGGLHFHLTGGSAVLTRKFLRFSLYFSSSRSSISLSFCRRSNVSASILLPRY
mmetsp:Transcript_20096/g.31901  ORF Transcript_20096/g.31901 Transcript_20096/m.31901 type:complete len:387 (+) Transcript_20096:77-1237(+)